LGLGNLYTLTKDFKNAREIFNKAEEICLRIDSKGDLSEVYAGIAYLESEMEHYDKGLEYINMSMRYAKEFGMLKSEMIALKIKGHILSKTGDMDKAIKNFNKSIEIAEKQKFILELGKLCYELGYILNIKGERKKSNQLIKKAERIFKETGTTF
ncbi:tetratricopeptide repeat protein, partial [candidate division WOR-3 bacterium]|nr:tetratricopeptide repeat protein [candidate division WOR-3 bacterium]